MTGPKTQLTRCLQCAEKVIPYNRGEIEDAPLFCPGGDCEQRFYENNNIPSILRLTRRKNPGYAVFTVTSLRGFSRVRISLVNDEQYKQIVKDKEDLAKFASLFG